MLRRILRINSIKSKAKMGMQSIEGPERQLWDVWHEGTPDSGHCLSTPGREIVLPDQDKSPNVLPERKHWKSWPESIFSSDCSPDWKCFPAAGKLHSVTSRFCLAGFPPGHQCEVVGCHQHSRRTAWACSAALPLIALCSSRQSLATSNTESQEVL